MYNNYFQLSEFLLPKTERISVEIANKIFLNFVPQLNIVRKKYMSAITVNSGYRPIEHELTLGRSGNSQHTFVGSGAVDIAGENIVELGKTLAMYGEFTRIAFYPDLNFFHLDQKDVPNNEQQFFISDKNSKWGYTSKTDFVRYITAL